MTGQKWTLLTSRLVMAVTLATLVMPTPALAQQARAQVVQPTPVSPSAPGSFAQLADRLLPAVVNISTTQNLKKSQRMGPDFPQFPPGSPFEEFFRDFMERQGQDRDEAPRKITSLGSGFIIDPSGYVVTNNHVIQDADEITVILHDDTNLKAKLIGKDAKTDLALLKVEIKKPLVAVTFGDSDAMHVGDWILAIGNPFGLGGTVTAGIISARARDINAGPYDDFLQTDASINRGNSGGPMFNLNGQVIGINTAIFSPSGGSVGIGFAIPSNMAQTVVNQIKQYGHTRRGWLGVRIQTVTEDIAENLGLKTGTHGALVASVTPKGPAAKAGLQPGDVVLSFNGHPVTEMRRLPRMVAETPLDKSVPMEVWRKGQKLTLSVKVGELETAEKDGLVPSEDEATPERAMPKTTEILGLGLTPLTPAARTRFNLPEDVKGVLIMSVKARGPIAELDLRPGDVIMEVNQQAVTAPAQVMKKIEEARKAGRKSVLLMVSRKGDLRFVALQVAELKADDKAQKQKPSSKDEESDDDFDLEEDRD